MYGIRQVNPLRALRCIHSGAYLLCSSRRAILSRSINVNLGASNKLACRQRRASRALCLVQPRRGSLLSLGPRPLAAASAVASCLYELLAVRTRCSSARLISRGQHCSMTASPIDDCNCNFTFNFVARIESSRFQRAISCASTMYCTVFAPLRGYPRAHRLASGPSSIIIDPIDHVAHIY